MRVKIASFIPAVGWLIISIILLSLPGDDLPESDLFNLPYFDKYVHLGMFFLLTILFSYPFIQAGIKPSGSVWLFTQITIYVIIYGVVMEFVQKYLVVNRSFDMVDIVFDSIGSIAGLVAIRLYKGKKIGPNGNRGRNQN